MYTYNRKLFGLCLPIAGVKGECHYHSVENDFSVLPILRPFVTKATLSGRTLFRGEEKITYELYLSDFIRAIGHALL